MMTNHHFLYSLKNNQAMSWSIVLTELIDNAIDAQASSIVAGWKGRKFSLHDNGTGVSPAGFEALYTLGGHVKEPTRYAIGRYGVGFKEAAGWLWGRTKVTSFHDRKSRQLIIDWEREARRGKAHDTVAPVTFLKGDRSVYHTKVECDGTDRKMPNPDVLTRIIRQLEHTYRPALEGGLSIQLRRAEDAPIVLQAAPWPLATADVQHVDETIMIEGRLCTLHAYLAADDVMFPGIHFALQGRAMGRCLPVESNRLYGWVHLGPEWEVGKNKTEITDPLKGVLVKAIEEVCAPLLAAARKQHLAAVIQDLVLDLNPYLDGLSAQCLVPKKRPSTKPGTVQPGNGHGGDHGGKSRDEEDDPTKRDPQNTRAPKIMLDFTKSATDQVVWLEIHDQTWTVKAKAEHLLEGFVTEKVFGGRGSDPSRMMNVILTTIAAAAVWNNEVAQAMPWLENVAPAQRYGLAMDRLWKTYLSMRQKTPMIEEMFTEASTTTEVPPSEAEVSPLT